MLISNICIEPRNANNPISFKSILNSLETNKEEIIKTNEILKNIEKGVAISKEDIHSLEDSKYFEILNDGDLTSLFKKVFDKVLENPTKSSVENLYSINQAQAEISIYDLYVRDSLSNNSSSGVFDALILKYNLEEKYPSLTKDEIRDKLIEFASIPRDKYSTSFRFELSKLDEYVKSNNNFEVNH